MTQLCTAPAIPTRPVCPVAALAAGLAALAIACGGPPEPVSTCEGALDQAMKVTRAEMKAPADERQLATIREISLARCKQDAWAAPALACIGRATTGRELGDCEGSKTKEQREKLDAALASVRGPGAAAGSGAGPGGVVGASGSAATGSAGGAGGSAGSAAGSGAPGSGSAGSGAPGSGSAAR